MTRTVRSRGPRRRGKQSTLVRPMPVFNTPPPPIPLTGVIRRVMYPTAVSDTEGISTATWTSGTTGDSSGFPGSSWNCYYYHGTSTNARTTGIDVIMNPVRWSPAAPASSGGTYDWWAVSGWGGTSTKRLGKYTNGVHFSAGGTAIAQGLLCSGHHAEFQEGFAELLFSPGDASTGNVPRVCVSSGSVWMEPTLQAIASTTTPFPFLASTQIAAIQHRVNGSAVGTVKHYPPTSRPSTTDWRCPISPGDVYEIDIWYRLIQLPNAGFSAGAAKQCWYIPRTKVSNGSQTGLLSPFVGDSSVIAWYPLAIFRNINFSPAFNYKEQTYEITISGHFGWTLKDGSDGPHKMVTGGGWNVINSGDGYITWYRVNQTSQYCHGFMLRYGSEVPEVLMWPGTLSSVTASQNLTPPNNTIALRYRPAAASGYPTSSVSADLGTIRHSDVGIFDQAGTTVFNLVPGSHLREGSDGGYNPQYSDRYGIDGRRNFPPISFASSDIPTSITLTRVDQ